MSAVVEQQNTGEGPEMSNANGGAYKLSIDAGTLEKMLRLWTANYNDGFSKVGLYVGTDSVRVCHFDQTSSMGIIGSMGLPPKANMSNTPFSFGLDDPQRFADYLKLCGGPVTLTLTDGKVEIQGLTQTTSTGVTDITSINKPAEKMIGTINDLDFLVEVFTTEHPAGAKLSDYTAAGYNAVKLNVSELKGVSKAIAALSREGRNRNLVSTLFYDTEKNLLTIKTQESGNDTADAVTSILKTSVLVSAGWKKTSLLSVYLSVLWSSLDGLAEGTTIYILKHPEESIVNMFFSVDGFRMTQIIGTWEEN